ncbi:50S ribosomal protein L24 [Candidatus Phytoplasma pini]|uniref:Large ribosomal subunit protein uL24 n=1 Tax=Candidatus Phytoplasma pini TaxID=267362 RepID=A0A559KJS9_9MOLU|nr:50S ribosomal protein L24 [Candidatus Phytoplasma pini]TVY12348.1 50S ribosomal protein L24 [Candidatus Phytoplasma pini]
MNKIKVGDIVAIISGKDRFFINEKGEKKIKTGKIVKVFFKEQKVLVEGINIVTKHKTSSQKDDKKGNIIKQEAPIHISNVALIESNQNVITRIGFRYELGKKVRYSKKTGNTIDISN